jgi:tRNA(Ile)-lysidine synthase
MPALAAGLSRFPGTLRAQRRARPVGAAPAGRTGGQDLAACLVDDCLDVARLRTMSADRARNMLRHWFALRGLRMPSTAWLVEMVTQLVEARPDAQLLVTHPDCHIRRHRDRLHITPKLAEPGRHRDPDDEGILVKEGEAFRWNGETSDGFPCLWRRAAFRCGGGGP